MHASTCIRSFNRRTHPFFTTSISPNLLSPDFVLKRVLLITSSNGHFFVDLLQLSYLYSFAYRHNFRSKSRAFPCHQMMGLPTRRKYSSLCISSLFHSDELRTFVFSRGLIFAFFSRVRNFFSHCSFGLQTDESSS